MAHVVFPTSSMVSDYSEPTQATTQNCAGSKKPYLLIFGDQDPDI